MVAAQGQRRRIHHFEIAIDGFIEGNMFEARRGLVELRISGINAVDLGGFEHNFRFHLAATQRCRRIGRKKRIARAGAENNDLALFQITHRFAANIGFDHRFDIDSRLHPRAQSGNAHGVLQRDRIDHRCQHAHIIGHGAIHASGTG